MQNAVNYGISFITKVKDRMDILVDKNGPSIITKSNEYKNGYINAKSRNAKIRFLTDVTKENIKYYFEIN